MENKPEKGQLQEEDNTEYTKMQEMKTVANSIINDLQKSGSYEDASELLAKILFNMMSKS